MCGKMQSSGLTEFIPFICTSALWGQSCFLLHLISCIAPQQSLFRVDPSFGSPHSHLEARSHWWLWHFLFINMARDIFISHNQSYGFSSSHVWMWELYLKKAECWRIEAFKLWCWRRLWRVPCIARRSNQSILKEIHPEYSFGRTDAEAKALILWPLDVKSLTHWKRPWCWERLRAEGEVGNRGWDGWMAS